MNSLSTDAGVAALAAGGVALVTLAWATWLAVTLRRVRAAQRAVLGDHDQRDLVDQGVALEGAFDALRGYVEDVALRLDGRLGETEQRLEGAFAHRALIRYDAYNEMSGRQSLSIALLDPAGSGIVLSSIHHRDQARLYAKQVRNGQPELELSPEEAEAIRLAMSGGADE